MDGLEALPLLRSQLPGAVIVMLTINREFEKKALQDGADAYILKNRMTDLIPAIREACSRADKLRCVDEVLMALRARVTQAQRHYAECHQQAKEASDLSSELNPDATGTADGASQPRNLRGS
jgi:DNA-binding NarL/FixJ family response regulator